MINGDEEERQKEAERDQKSGMKEIQATLVFGFNRNRTLF